MQNIGTLFVYIAVYNDLYMLCVSVWLAVQSVYISW